jgi:hypothetical protein
VGFERSEVAQAVEGNSKGDAGYNFEPGRKRGAFIGAEVLFRAFRAESNLPGLCARRITLR